MPRNASVNIENSFVKGLITEATGLNFPENACTETYNCVFSHTGEVSRRLGLDYEETFVVDSIDTDDNAIREFLWKAVAQNGEFTFIVLQVGATLNFYSMATTTLSTTKKTFDIDINDFKVTGSPAVESITCSFASGNGFLFVAHPYCEPFYVEYHVDTDTITTAAIDVRIRDWKGVEDNLDDDQRPSTLSKEHHYNLLNQGWNVNVALTSNTYNWTVGSPLQFWKTAPFFSRGDFPSNSDIWWSYKSIMRPILDDHGNVIIPTPTEAFSMIEAQNVDKTGSSLAPKGHYIFTAWNIDRAAVPYSSDDLQTSLSGIPLQTSGYQRPSQVAFYASRVWYAAIDANLYNTKIYFSKIIERNSDFGRCYQLNDPTTEKASDLLPSDGGEIKIPEISRIVKLMQAGQSLFVFATNGVWRITGSSGVGFSANDYSITKISPINALSETSFVDVEGAPMWWNDDGIWTIQMDSTGTTATVQSITFTTIQSFVDDILSNNKRYIKGAYNPLEKTVQWLYRSTPATTVKANYQYDRILNLSLINQAFYPWSIADNCNKIVGIVVIQGVGHTATEINVVNNAGSQVITGAGNVVVDRFDIVDIASRYKYITTSDCFVDTGTSSITYTPGEFQGYLDNTTFGVGIIQPGSNGIMVGANGKYYTYADDNTGVEFCELQMFDGTGHEVSYSQAAFRNDIISTLGFTTVSWSARRMLIPVPFTPYFYLEGATTSDAGFHTVIGLYKIDNTGTIVFQGARGYPGSAFTNLLASQHYYYAFGFKGNPQTDPTDSTLLIAAANSAAIVFDSTSDFVLEFPSVNYFIAHSGETSTPYSSLFNTTVSPVGSMFKADPFESNAAFFLPINNGGTWDNLLCRYITKNTAAYMIANPTTFDPVFPAAALLNPNGFIIATPLSTGIWTVISSSFRDANSNALVPFADLGLERDGSAGNYVTDDWSNPSVQYDSTDNVTLITWGRRFTANDLNYDPSGSYVRSILQSWDPIAQAATWISDVSGSAYIVTTDLGLPASNLHYPTELIMFLSPNSTELFGYVYGFTGITRYLMFKLGNVVLDLTPSSTGLTFSEFTNPTYTDWVTSGESKDYLSYFISGYKVHGDAIRKFQSNYTNIYTRNDLFSVFDFQSRWDYAISGDTGRWANKQRITQDNVNYQYRTKRLKNRGHGKALQYKVNSVIQQPFNIVGWSSWETGNISA